MFHRCTNIQHFSLCFVNNSFQKGQFICPRTDCVVVFSRKNVSLSTYIAKKNRKTSRKNCGNFWEKNLIYHQRFKVCTTTRITINKVCSISWSFEFMLNPRKWLLMMYLLWDTLWYSDSQISDAIHSILSFVKGQTIININLEIL